MADELARLRDRIAGKRGIGQQQVARLIREKEKRTLFTKRLATLAVALDNDIHIGRIATSEELGTLRESRRIGEATPAPPKLTPAPSPSRETAKATRKRTSRPSGRRPNESPQDAARARRIVVVHGRNDDVRRDLFRLLRALDLLPIEWVKAILETGKGTPSISEILDALFAKAAAVVVLLTPDDRVTLDAALRKPTDPPYEKETVGQPRANVFFEAGLAFARFRDATVLVQVGRVKLPSDLDLHVTRLTNSRESRHELMTKLKAAGCDVDADGSEWLSEGNFEREELYA